MTHDLNLEPTASTNAIGEAVSIDFENTVRQGDTPSNDTMDFSSTDVTTIYVVKQVLDKEKIMAVIRDLSLDPRASTSAIGKAVSLDFENTVYQLCTPSSDIPDPSPIEVSADSIIQQVLSIVNRERSRVGLSPLRLQSQLTAAAQIHSNDMARHNFIGHTGSDGSSFVDRIKLQGYNFRRLIGENVAAGQSSPQEVMRDWMNSRGHRENILNPIFRDIGIGYARGNRPYWTQTFGA